MFLQTNFKMSEIFDNYSSINVGAFACGDNESVDPSIVMDNIILSEASYHIPNTDNLPTCVAGKDYKDIVLHILKHFDDKQDILNIAIILNQVAEVYDKRCAESALTGASEKKFRPTSPLVLQHDECRLNIPEQSIPTQKASLATGDMNTKDQPPEPLDIQENRLVAGDVEIGTNINWNFEDDPEILRGFEDLVNFAESGGKILKNDDAPTPTIAINQNTDVIESHAQIEHIPVMENQVHTSFRRHEFLGDSPIALRLRGLWNEIESLRPRRNQNATVNNDELEARATIRRDEFQDKDIGGQGGRNQRHDFLRLVLQYRDTLYTELDYGHLARVSDKREGQVMLLDFILSNGGRVLRYHSNSNRFYVANPYEALEIMAAKMRDGRLKPKGESFHVY